MEFSKQLTSNMMKDMLSEYFDSANMKVELLSETLLNYNYYYV